MIRAAGSSGTAATTWAAECRRRAPPDSGAGKRSGGTSRRSRSTASRATRCAGPVSVKLYCSGPTIAAPYENEGAGLRACIFRLTDPGQFDILVVGPGWRGSDAIRSTTSTRVHHAARRRGRRMATCGARAAGPDEPADAECRVGRAVGGLRRHAGYRDSEGNGTETAAARLARQTQPERTPV